MRKQSELIFNLLLPLVDFFLIVGAFVMAYVIRVKIDHRPVPYPIAATTFLRIFLIVLPVWILIFALVGLYNLSNLRGRLDEVGKVFVGTLSGTMFLILVDFLHHTSIFPSRSIPIYGLFLSFFLVVGGRLIVRAIQRWLFRYDIGIHNTILVGSGSIAAKIYTNLRQTNQSGYRIIAVLDSAQVSQTKFKGAKSYKSFAAILEHNPVIDDIIQADAALDADQVLELVTYASNHHIAYRFVPNQFGLYATNSSVGTLAGEQIIEIKQTPLDGWGRIIKRFFDIVGASLALIVLSPVFLGVAVTIALTDRGPIIYRHRRLSRTGKALYVYKFRSMYWRYSDGAGRPFKTAEEALRAMGHEELVAEFKLNQKLVYDPRVTPIGRFLRHISLDELPQLFNVLRGEMSMVGPRPILEQELERYGPSSAVFLALKPGLTGLWQISGRNDVGYDERVKLDIYYVEHWSLLLDLKILIKTAFGLLRGGGAY